MVRLRNSILIALAFLAVWTLIAVFVLPDAQAHKRKHRPRPTPTLTPFSTEPPRSGPFATPRPGSWSTDVLAVPNAGFAHAMNAPRTPVLVQRSDSPVTRAAMDYWNTAAGWELLVFGEPPEIFITFNAATNDALWSDPAPYESCRVNMASSATDFSAWGTLAHEFGHCLGFKHVEAGIMGGEDVNLARDRLSLALVGYRTYDESAR